ncbi:MAG: hypothetical protein GY856_38930 [bacterium]|nr:hypothetical protein [bacterium]
MASIHARSFGVDGLLIELCRQLLVATRLGELVSADGRAAAERRAAEVERLRGEAREALRERIQAVLAGAQDRVRHTMNRLVGEAYRRTLIQLVHDNGGRLIRDQRTGSVIDLELELF